MGNPPWDVGCLRRDIASQHLGTIYLYTKLSDDLMIVSAAIATYTQLGTGII
ncbi:hypothetical protein [Fischerella thermalis]|uniref:hypothetical protein n=1 Tax=Fischerella thermalis TaxID=372787 RepID=UPI0015E07C3C|nr:hypothetical protein [Fischerella thermalis]